MPDITPINLTPYGEECIAGLPNAKQDIDAALKRQAYYDYDGFRYEADYKRDAESSFDFQGRPHRPSGFLRECIDILTEDVYAPGPARKWNVAAGDALLQTVYRDNHINALMSEADKLSTLNDACAIQIDAGKGVWAEKPITLRLWGREQFHAWTDPDDVTTPLVVVTIDKFDLQTRYRLWSSTEVWTYLTKRAEDTAGGRVAYLTDRSPHDYGRLPFAFVQYSLPIRDFFTSSIGEFLAHAEIRIDDRLSQLDESYLKNLNPIPVASGVPDAWKPIVEPNRFIRMPLSAPYIGATGGFEPSPRASLTFLDRKIDESGCWDDLTRYMNQAFEAARVPIQAARMEQTMHGAASGLALLVEMAPLLKRAKRRQLIFTQYEEDLAAAILTCTGSHYGKPELVAAATAGHLVAAFPQASVPVQTPDQLQMVQAEISGGFKSFISAMQEWYAMSRDEAIEHIQSIEADNKLLAQIAPSLLQIAETEPGLPSLTQSPASAANPGTMQPGTGQPEPGTQPQGTAP